MDQPTLRPKTQRGAQNTRQQNDVVGSTDTPWQDPVHRKPEYLSLSTGSKFATPASF